MAKVTISFSLNAQDDRDVIAWLERLEKGTKSAAIRDALRAHIKGQGVTMADIYQEVREIKRQLKNGVAFAAAASTAETDDADEPPDVAATLDNLGL